MTTLTLQQIESAGKIQARLGEMNLLLKRVGQIADELTSGGYDVCMTIWDRDRGSCTVNGRLQSNVCKASIRPAEDLHR